MPVTLGEWRVRIGTFVRRQKKEYDYNFFLRKLFNLVKTTKIVKTPKGNPDPASSPSSESSKDANGSGTDASQDTSPSCNKSSSQHDLTSDPGSSCDVNSPKCDASSIPKAPPDISTPRVDNFTESGPAYDVQSSDKSAPHFSPSCADMSSSTLTNESSSVPDSTDIQNLVIQQCPEGGKKDHPRSSSFTQRSNTDQSDVCKTHSNSASPTVMAGHASLDTYRQDKDETSTSQYKKDMGEKEVGSVAYPAIGSGLTCSEDDAVEGNDHQDMTSMLLMRSGDVELHPGPNDKPFTLTELELYLLADSMEPSDFRKVGLALGFSEAKLSQFEKYQCNTMQAAYHMLFEWLKTVRESEAREILVNTLKHIRLIQLADSLQRGQIGEDIPSLTEEQIQQVAEDVKRYFALELCGIQADPLNSDMLLQFERIFTNLTLMEEDKGTKTKTPLAYSDLLKIKVNGIYPKRLLVEGEAGVGKTTLCAKIAWDWIHGFGYQDFKLVLVILLCKAKDKTVGEIVKSYLSDNNPVTTKQLDKYILTHPDDVFLVLDGLDEMAVDLSSIQQLTQITINRLFKSGTVLITSRKWKSDEIRNSPNLRKAFALIAVEGFIPENLASYITKFFHPDTAASEELIRFVLCNSVIQESMSPYPIYAAMLCVMWKEFDGARREAMAKLKTFSQLFDEMISFLIDHYLSKHFLSPVNPASLMANRSNILHHLIQIGRVAFQGLTERRLVFSEEEFHNCPESVDTGCKVGVLTRERFILSRQQRRDNPHFAVSAVLFPHKFFREYLSGIYLASIYKSNRSDYDRVMVKILENAREYQYLLYFTSAQQKEVGMDIVSRLMAHQREYRSQHNMYRSYNGMFGSNDSFIVDVAYESQDQDVAKAVVDQLVDKTSTTLEITDEMQEHTIAGLLFLVHVHHCQLNGVTIEKSCGMTASEDLAEFICSLPSLRSATIKATLHDVFYSVLANKAQKSKIETLVFWSMDLNERSTASRDLALFICKMPHLKNLTLDRVHNDFYSTASSMASSVKGCFPQISNGNFTFNGSSLESLESFLVMLSEYQGIVSEEEFGKLSELTPSSHYMQVGKVLGITDALLRVIKAQSSDMSTAFMKVFKKWRDSQPPGTNIRAILAEKLKQSDLGEAASRVLNKSLISRITVVTGNDPERIKAYEEALESGKVRCNTSRIMVVGPAGIGKTSLIRRLTGQPFSHEEKSTVGTEHNTVKKNVVSGWKLDNNTDKDEVAECMVLHEQSEEQEMPSDSSATPLDTSHSAPSDAASPSEVTQSSSEDSPDKRKYIEKRKLLVQIQQEALPSSVTKAGVPDVPQNVLERRSSSDNDSGGKQRKVIAEGMTKKRITNATSTANDISYSIWDFGGQVIYYITHPLFLSWRSLYIVVFPFHLDFNAEPPRTEEISVGQSNKGPRGNPHREGSWVKSKISQFMKMLRGKRHAEQAHSEVLQIDNSSSSEQEIQGATPRTHRTILDLLHFWLMSICVHAVPPRDCERFEPKILLVGTFRHEHGITEEDVKSKKSQIKKMVQGKPYAKQVHSEILQIDNSSSSEEEVTYLQEQIDKLVKESAYMQEDLPIRWRTFSDKMRALKKDTVLLDEACTAMTDVRIIKDMEVELVLEFYHDTGDLIYHQGCELIVLNPQILNNFVSNIITVVDDEKLKGELGDEWTTLIEKGILKMKLLEAVLKSNEGKHDELKYLVDMMVKFDLICKIPEDSKLKGCYFVPCCSRPELSELQKPDEDDIDDKFEFIIDFNKFLPDGFLHRLYVRMALWSMEGPEVPYKPTFHSREMLFYIDELHRVVMTNTIKGDDAHRIKVLICRLKPKEAPKKRARCINLKRDFHTYLTETLEDLKKTWARRISYSPGLPCKKCHDKGKRFSLVSLDAFLKCEDSAHCGECGDAIHAGRVKQVLLWTPAKATEDASESRCDLEMDERLSKLAEHIPHGKYGTFCGKLGITFNRSNNILKMNQNDYCTATRVCLANWKDRTGGNLDDLEQILIDVGLQGLLCHLQLQETSS